MRQGSAVASGCLALLSLLRVSEGDALLGVFLAVLAVGALIWGLRGRGVRPAYAADSDALRDSARHHRGWRRIVVAGLVVTAVGAVTIPQMALVVGGLTVYAAHRMRASGRSARLLATTA
ncbi:MAG: hypothetical protein ACRDO4_15000 [Nocardioides sp.]